MYYTGIHEGSKREGYHVNGNPQICRSSQAMNPSSFEDDRPLTYIAEQSDGVAMPISDEVSGHNTFSFASAPTSAYLSLPPTRFTRLWRVRFTMPMRSASCPLIRHINKGTEGDPLQRRLLATKGCQPVKGNPTGA
jgi:hypothetical protein